MLKRRQSIVKRAAFSLLLAVQAALATGFEWPTYIFEDQFEVGDLYTWSTRNERGPGSSCQIQKEIRHSGEYAAKLYVPATAAARSAYLCEQFSSRSSVHMRAYMYVGLDLALNPGQLVEIFAPAKTGLGPLESVQLKLTTAGNLVLRSRSCGESTREFVLGEWHCVEVYYKQGAGDGAFTVWLDSEPVLSRTDLTLTNACNEVRAGIIQTVSTSQSTIQATVYLDDVRVDEQHNGPVDVGMTLIHPDFRSRIGSPAIAVLTGDRPDDRLVVTLTSDSGLNRTLLTKSQVNGRHDFRVNLRALQKGNYVLRAELLDRNGRLRVGKQYDFVKNYDGDPRFTIDEYNNFVLNGKKFFMLTPFVLQPAWIADWKGSNIINMLYGCDWNDKTIEGVINYMDKAAKSDLMVFPPMPIGEVAQDGTKLRKTPEFVLELVRNLAWHPNLAGWVFIDEPELYGYSSADHKSWWDVAKDYDGSKMVHVNLMGNTWGKSDHNIALAHSFSYPYLCADSMGFDMYPYEYTNTQSLAEMVLHSQRVQKWNFDLIPTTVYVQTQDTKPGYNGGAPTPKQVEMMAWLSTVAGAKGVQWFHYFGYTPPEHLAAMSRFGAAVKQWNDVILSNEEAPPLVIEEPSGEGRFVYGTVRRYQGEHFFFVVNTKPEAVLVRLQSPALRAGSAVTAYPGLTRMASGDGVFEDVIDGDGVRIYALKTSQPNAPLNLRRLE